MNRVIRNVPAIAYLLGLLALLGGVIAQTPAVADSPTPLGGIVALGIIVAFLLVVGISVKLYDITRKREEEGLALQARLSDTLLEDPNLAPLPLAATVHVPFRRSGAPTVEVTGHVPTPELREAAMRTVLDNIARTWPSARVEDRIVVEPHRMRHAAA
jgi:hypothetical protein